MKRSTSRDVIKKEKRQAEIVQAHRDYLDLAKQFVHKSQTTLAAELVDISSTAFIKTLEMRTYIKHAERQIDQIERRVVQGENHTP